MRRAERWDLRRKEKGRNHNVVYCFTTVLFNLITFVVYTSIYDYDVKVKFVTSTICQKKIACIFFSLSVLILKC